MRWSPWVSTMALAQRRPAVAGRRSCPPGSSATSTPKASSPAAIRAMRLLSFTRISPMPLMTVLPAWRRPRPPPGSDIRRSSRGLARQEPPRPSGGRIAPRGRPPARRIPLRRFRILQVCAHLDQRVVEARAAGGSAARRRPAPANPGVISPATIRKGGRGRVARHRITCEPCSVSGRPAGGCGRRPIFPEESGLLGRDLQMGAERGQHALGVVAGGSGLDHLDPAFGVQPGQQQGRLHLGRGHRQAVGDAPEVTAMELERAACQGLRSSARAPIMPSAGRAPRPIGRFCKE